MPTYMVEIEIIYDSPENRYVMDQNIINTQEEFDKKLDAKQQSKICVPKPWELCPVHQNPSYMVRTYGSI